MRARRRAPAKPTTVTNAANPTTSCAVTAMSRCTCRTGNATMATSRTRSRSRVKTNRDENRLMASSPKAATRSATVRDCIERDIRPASMSTHETTSSSAPPTLSPGLEARSGSRRTPMYRCKRPNMITGMRRRIRIDIGAPPPGFNDAVANYR